MFKSMISWYSPGMGPVSGYCVMLWMLDVVCVSDLRLTRLLMIVVMIMMGTYVFISFHPHMLFLTQPDCMSSTVVKQRINVTHPFFTGSYAADYTGAVNAQGAPHGRGSYVIVVGYGEGHTYTGQLNNGQRDGVGKFTRSDGWYAGEWKADKMEGYGRVHVCVVFVCRAHCFRGGGLMVITRECG